MGLLTIIISNKDSGNVRLCKGNRCSRMRKVQEEGLCMNKLQDVIVNDGDVGAHWRRGGWWPSQALRHREVVHVIQNPLVSDRKLERTRLR